MHTYIHTVSQFTYMHTYTLCHRSHICIDTPSLLEYSRYTQWYIHTYINTHGYAHYGVANSAAPARSWAASPIGPWPCLQLSRSCTALVVVAVQLHHRRRRRGWSKRRRRRVVASGIHPASSRGALVVVLNQLKDSTTQER